MTLHPLSKEALDFLFNIQNGQSINPQDIKKCYEMACDTLPQDILKWQFMPIINQIWRIL